MESANGRTPNVLSEYALMPQYPMLEQSTTIKVATILQPPPNAQPREMDAYHWPNAAHTLKLVVLLAQMETASMDSQQENCKELRYADPKYAVTSRN